MHLLRRLGRLAVGILVAILIFATPRSSISPEAALDFQLTPVLGSLAFDFVRWEVRAVLGELRQRTTATAALGNREEESRVLHAYFDALQRRHDLEEEQIRALAGSALAPGSAAVREIQAELDGLEGEIGRLQPPAEAIITRHIEGHLVDQGLSPRLLQPLRVPLPPVLAEFTAPPLALVISRRDEIRVKRQTYLQPGLTPQEMTRLEEAVDTALGDHVSLTVPIGGLGTYPTMILPTGSAQFAVSATAHEWAHAYLFLRPLGNRYDENEELRILNEAVADLVGHEVASALLPRFGFEPPPPPQPPRAEPAEPEGFDFQLFMRDLRLEVERLLEEGRVEEAEERMREAREQLEGEHDIVIRKVNQAYFAFFGTYEGAPGAVSPIPAQVREYRGRFDSLGAFLRDVATISTHEEFERRLQAGDLEPG